MKILFKLNQCMQQRQLEKKVWIFPILLAYYATYLKNQGHEVIWDKEDDGTYDRIITSEEQIDVPFLELPMADRILTDAKNPKWQKNGNYKFLPGGYIQSSNKCWYSACSFCKEKTIKESYQVKSVDFVMREIEECKSQGYKEIFDDSGTFPTGRWLDEFCKQVANKDITISCNMRIADIDYKRLKISGFRMLLYGIESFNQQTLDRIGKGVKVEDIIPTIKKASNSGLEPHITVIFGWEWETDANAINTLKLVHYLLKKGFAKTAQASFIHQQGIKGNESQRHYIRDIYSIWKSPQFWFNKIKDIHNVDDLKYLWRMIKAGLNDRR